MRKNTERSQTGSRADTAADGGCYTEGSGYSEECGSDTTDRGDAKVSDRDGCLA